MSESLVKNLRYMLLIIGKAGTSQNDCPVSSTIYGTMISWLFDDVANHPKIVHQYVKNREMLDASLHEDGLSMSKIIETRDRIIFKHIDLFPDSIKSKYGDHIEWFSRYLTDRASDKVVETLYRYIIAMDGNMRII